MIEFTDVVVDHRVFYKQSNQTLYMHMYINR